MGMSASQARLIALTARMNDIEYQGQQINQQRTTLASQINALYNTLLEMEVPTPPSTTEYTKVQYSGTLNASKFTIGNVVPTGKDNGVDKFNADLKYKRTGHSVLPSAKTAIVKPNKEKVSYVPANLDALKTLKGTKAVLNLDALKAIKGPDELPNEDDDNSRSDDIYIKTTIGAIRNARIEDYDSLFGEDGNGVDKNNINDCNENTVVYVKANTSNLALDEWKELVDAEQGDDGKTLYKNVYVPNDSNNDIVSTENVYEWNKCNDDQIAQKGLYFINQEGGDPIRIDTYDLFIEYADRGNIYQLGTGDGQIEAKNLDYNENGGNYMVGNMSLMDLSNPSTKKMLGDSYDSYITALRNAFQSSLDTGLSDSEVADNFYVYIEQGKGETVTPHFVWKADLTTLGDDQQRNIKNYEYTPDGTYDDVDSVKGCELEFDATTGRITKIGISDGNGQVTWVDVKAETVTDNEAYERAFNDYEYEKAKYDKKQQEINAKTSIVQQQDKSLELKLTRLDNERNAVNTEIDAVKKVVSDNIEKSFKTFSG